MCHALPEICAVESNSFETRPSSSMCTCADERPLPARDPETLGAREADADRATLGRTSDRRC